MGIMAEEAASILHGMVSPPGVFDLCGKLAVTSETDSLQGSRHDSELRPGVRGMPGPGIFMTGGAIIILERLVKHRGRLQEARVASLGDAGGRLLPVGFRRCLYEGGRRCCGCFQIRQDRSSSDQDAGGKQSRTHRR